MTVLIIDDPGHVALAAERAAAGATVVAVTAAAASALEALGIPFEPVHRHADLDGLSACEGDLIECTASLTSAIDRDVPETLGALRDQAYCLQYSLGAIVARTHLVLASARALGAREIVLPVGRVDPWFAPDGLAEDPWLPVIERIAREEGVAVTRVPVATDPVPGGGAAGAGMPLWRGIVRRLLAHRRTAPPDTVEPAAELRDALHRLRVVGVGYYLYDWEPVLAAAERHAGAEVVRLLGAEREGSELRYAFTGLWRGTRQVELPALPAPVELEEQARVRRLVTEWIDEQPGLVVEVGGIDALPGLRHHLASVAGVSPALARHADATADAVLDRVRPDALCFFSMPWLAAARLARRAREQGVPSLCYQHGGAYGTHRLAQHELMEFARADVFLSYGTGIVQSSQRLGPARARFVPVGSTRLAEAGTAPTGRPGRRRRGRRPVVLWVGEASTGNTYASWFMMEDTLRFDLERSCLGRLAASPLDVVYRPFPGQGGPDTVAAWVRSEAPAIRLSQHRSLSLAAQSADVVFTATSSSTSWAEVLAQRVPLVVYCDPEHTLLEERFAVALSEATLWCRTTVELEDAVERLVRDGEAFVRSIAARDVEPWLRAYAVGPQGGSAVQRALEVLASERRGAPQPEAA